MTSLADARSVVPRVAAATKSSAQAQIAATPRERERGAGRSSGASSCGAASAAHPRSLAYLMGCFNRLASHVPLEERSSLLSSLALMSPS